MLRIADGLYLLQAPGFVNAYLIEGARDLTLIDTGHARSAEALLAEIKEGGFRLEDIQRVVLTHAHPDHIGGAAALLKKRRIKVFAHPADMPPIQGKAPLPPFRGWKGALAGLLAEVWYRPEVVDVLVPVSPTQPLRQLPQWQVLHTPGHTQGSLSLYHPVRRILLCGDALMTRGGKLAALPREFSVDDDAVSASVRALAGLDCELLAPGHGPPIRDAAFRQIRTLAAALEGFAR